MDGCPHGGGASELGPKGDEPGQQGPGRIIEGSGQYSVQRCALIRPSRPLTDAAPGPSTRRPARRCPTPWPPAEKHYALAQQFYTKALEVDPTSAVLFGNRAFAAIRLEVGGGRVCVWPSCATVPAEYLVHRVDPIKLPHQPPIDVHLILCHRQRTPSGTACAR